MGFLSNTSSGTVFNNSITYPYIKEWEGKILERQVIIPESKVLREINIYSDKAINLYWGDQTIPFWSISNQVFIDSSTSTSLSIEPLEGEANVKILVRSTKKINYELGGQLMIPIKVRLAIGTGANYVDVNANSYDADSYQYLINLQKLKDSESGVTGFKLFDIFSFYPGKAIEFFVAIDGAANNNYQPDTIAIQLFDPLAIGEVVFAIANDVVNLEVNNLGDKFVGNLTRDALYSKAVGDKITVSPDYSRHVGRFVAIRDGYFYDTAIIKSYTPNTNELLGGTFVLTGSF